MKKQRHSVYIALIFFFLWFIFVIFCSFWFYHLERQISEIQSDVEMFSQGSQAVVQTEYTQAIDFLENEVAKYREFVERQQSFLIWLVGLIGVGLSGLMAFLGIKGQKDISNIIREQYAGQVQSEISNLIGGQSNIDYLMRCVEKEGQANEKKILFLFRRKKNENLYHVYNLLKERDYQVGKKVIQGSETDRKIKDWVNGQDIIVYQVDDSEWKREGFDPDEHVMYARLSKICSHEEVYGILYCENNTALDRSLYQQYFYINNANYGLTLMERLFQLLYFV